MASTVEKLQAFIEARRQGESIAAIARRLKVSTGTVRYWLAKARRSPEDAPIRRPGRPSVLDEHAQEEFRRLLAERPSSTLVEILGELETRTAKHLEEGTARQYLRRMGIRRASPVREKAPALGGDRTTRYRPRHRREPTRQNYPSDLTDAEWEILRPVFSAEGRPGRPPSYDRRRILDAIFYVVRGGIAWRMLPHDFPIWENVYAHFRRWSAAGLFELMHDLLRARWREREGKKPTATGSIIDSQSVKTTEKGGPAATTPARRPKDGSATSS